jgi:hypothetical protein
VSFAIEPPTVWMVGWKLTGFGAALFAFVLTFWVYGPIITTGLALLRKLRPAVTGSAGFAWRPLAQRAGLALVAGIGLAALAAPFHLGTLGLPTAAERFGIGAALALALSNAVAEELLLRLFVFTAVFVLAFRLLPNQKLAPLAALGVASLADLLLHLPAVAMYGLPGTGAVLAYVAARLAIPAVLFGYLYWRRGLGTSVAAHATANAAVGLLAL